MSRARLVVNVASVSLGGIVLAALAAHYLFTAPTGPVLLIASAKHADSVARVSVSLHSGAGWTDLGSIGQARVPAAPDSTNLWQGDVTVGHYDRVRFSHTELPADIQVARDQLTAVLIPIQDGQAISAPIYSGSAVSVGLSELAGNFRAVPAFNLVDQFNRPFTKASIAGHEVVVAAFHTNCHETCPLYTGLFLQLRRQLPPWVMLVEATTAPEEDTPDVLREYAGRVGASWTFATGSAQAVTEFWRPFDVQLSNGDSHSSTLAVIDRHGFIRTYWQGAPDVGGQLPAGLSEDLSPAGRTILQSHGNKWGQAEVLDSIRSSGGLIQQGSSGEGPAPAFSLKTLAGKTTRLADVRGRPVLINFWASYCQ
ncbi:MAG: SCO family protein, partial [Chloroflexota bacterium]